MSDYVARFDCIDSVVDFVGEVDSSVKLSVGADGLTELKIFLNTGKGTFHSALDLIGIWYANYKFGDEKALTMALFAPESENDFTIFRIARPKKAGEKGFVEFEVALDAADPWSVQTNRGLLAVRKIRLAIHLSLAPVQ